MSSLASTPFSLSHIHTQAHTNTQYILKNAYQKTHVLPKRQPFLALILPVLEAEEGADACHSLKGME